LSTLSRFDYGSYEISKTHTITSPGPSRPTTILPILKSSCSSNQVLYAMAFGGVVFTYFAISSGAELKFLLPSAKLTIKALCYDKI
jgi:hypothetical protein